MEAPRVSRPWNSTSLPSLLASSLLRLAWKAPVPLGHPNSQPCYSLTRASSPLHDPELLCGAPSTQFMLVGASEAGEVFSQERGGAHKGRQSRLNSHSCVRRCLPALLE